MIVVDDDEEVLEVVIEEVLIQESILFICINLP
jgi:hypothetical protein